jgi:molybdate transport system substrate-binding protein
VFNFAGSQQLTQQIVQGAPADVFASANQKHMDVVIADGRILKGSDQPFVNNRLIAILPAENHAKILTLNDLAKSNLRLVVATEEVPIGLYTQEFLTKTALDASFEPDFKEKVMANVVSYETNVKAVVSKVVLGEADAGIVYKSDISKSNAAKIIQLFIPDNVNVIAVYPIAPLADSHHPDSAKSFIEFVISPQGQEILAQHGLIPLGP